MTKGILTAFALGVLALGIWAGSDLWTANSQGTTETTGEQASAEYRVTGMT